jgi:hypothetical protein
MGPASTAREAGVRGGQRGTCPRGQRGRGGRLTYDVIGPGEVPVEQLQHEVALTAARLRQNEVVHLQPHPGRLRKPAQIRETGLH